ncbi:hypothetical protein K501DRAFT_197233 [Backusella circina FSU 941]|nr:hypothetical protein K501DRAFT_197233 [Backusella circina FSU 941]
MGFWASFFKYLASVFAFAALIFQFFTLLGNTYNVAFIRDLYLARLTKNNDKFIDFGLWNACTGNNGTVSHCDTPQPAFVWTDATNINDFVSGLNGYDKAFLANFILYWCGFALTLFAFCFSVSTHFGRITDSMAAFSTLLAFLTLLVVFCIMIVLAYKGINNANAIDEAIDGSIGPATWCTLASMCCLFLATIYYCLGCWLRKKNAKYTKV